MIQCLSSAHIIMYLLSQFSLAQFYHNGTGMKKDLEMALKLYEVKEKTIVNIGRYRNVRGLGKSMVVFHLFE